MREHVRCDLSPHLPHSLTPHQARLQIVRLTQERESRSGQGTAPQTTVRGGCRLSIHPGQLAGLRVHRLLTLMDPALRSHRD